MSPTSYQTALPRVAVGGIIPARHSHQSGASLPSGRTLTRFYFHRVVQVGVSRLYTGEMLMTRTEEATFERFVADHEPKLRRALVSRYGSDVGREATAEALAYAWEHWDRIAAMENPAGYLYRVGQSSTRRLFTRRPHFPPAADAGMPWVEPGLPGALTSLSSRQRQAVVLVHGFDYTLAEVADLIGISRTSVQNHLERGLSKLRASLEASA